MNFYVSLFKNSKIVNVSRYGDAGPGPKGTVMTGTFRLAGQQFHALNGGPQYKFTPALSLMVNCEDQAEIDALWEKLAEGGEHIECGWLTDKFGVSWQIVPRMLPELLGGDVQRTDRVMRAVMSMKKLDIAQLEQAGSPQQDRLQRVATEITKRETVYADFVIHASNMLLRAYTSDEIELSGDEQRLIGLLNRMRFFAPPNVVAIAEAALRAIIEISLKPRIELRQLAMQALSKRLDDPLLEFSVICRADLDTVHRTMA